MDEPFLMCLVGVCGIVLSVTREGAASMDLWDDDYREPSEDDKSARRVLSVAIAFVNAPRPLSTTEVRRDLYSELGDEAFRKAFARDRERLATAGLVLRKGPRVDNEATWETDEESSFARESLLTRQDALTLDLLLLPLASDPSFPYAHDLRMALSKIDRSFDGSSTICIPTSARQRDSHLTSAEECLARRQVIHMTYERADGTVTDRDVAPYGIFSLNGNSYLVAARLVAGTPQDPHTYNLSRVRKLQVVKRKTYEVPDDFDVRDFIRLPFQIGPVTTTAAFVIPADVLREVRPRVMGHGTWSRHGEDARFVTDCADIAVAAAWAVAEGVIPVSPDALVDAWRELLVDMERG